MEGPGHPRVTRVGPGTATLQGTAVALGGRAVILCGPPGAGKSGLAAQMIVAGAGLVADDLCLLRRAGAGVEVGCPPGGPTGLIELRGLGLAAVAPALPAPLAALWLVGPSAARLPEAETMDVLGQRVAVLRHPARHDAAAKVTLWLAAAP